MVSSTEIQAAAPPQGEGCVDVTVCNADGECSTPLGNGFYYAGAPAVTSIAPAGGVIEGGAVVTIAGANFMAPCTVQFGSGRYGSGCTVVASVCEVLDRGTCSLTGPTVLQVTSPPGIAYGCVDVIVDTGVGTPAVVQSGFCYLEPPRIDSVSPGTGSTCGGAQVVITGANFVAPCDVFFGDTRADASTVVDAGTIVAITPPRFDPGVVDVMVDTKVPRPAVLPDGFTYDRIRPQIDSIAPADGPMSAARW